MVTRRKNRCLLTNYACSVAYAKLNCRCDACKTWKREYDRRGRLANPEKIREQRRRWRAAHPDRVRAHQLKWRERKRAELADKLAATKGEQP